MVGRKRQTAQPQALSVHQIVAYNFRRAREEAGWTQSQTGERLEPLLGYRLNQAAVSAIETTFEGERRRTLDAAELAAFARCFRRPIGWFFIPPAPLAAQALEPADDPSEFRAADLLTLVVGGPEGWQSFLDRIGELLANDTDDAAWEALHDAFGGRRRARFEGQLDLRRRAVQSATLVRFTGPEERVVKGLAALLVELVKLSPEGLNRLRESDPDEALAILAEGDELIRPFIQPRGNQTAAGSRPAPFEEAAEIDLREAVGRQLAEE